MKKTIYYPINDQYRAGVEVDGYKIILWIEQPCKFLWIFDDWERTSWLKAFHLVSDKPENKKTPSLTSYTLCGSFLGYIQHLTFQYVYFDDFDLTIEISKLYHDFIESKQKEAANEKKLNYIINKITDI